MKQRVKTLTLLPLLTCVLLMMTLAVPLNASAASRASSQHVSAPAQHFSSLPVFIKNTKSESLNWSGYAATGGHYTKVSANWTEPGVKCSGTDTYSSFWVGLDGYANNTVEQTGTQADCYQGSLYYFAWYEMFPNPPVVIKHPVQPGDAFAASVTAVTDSSFKLVIHDSTQGWNFDMTQTLKGAQLSSAEVIAEAPGSPTLPLADFGTVHFRLSMVDGRSIGSFSPVEIVMATSGGTVKAQPSALSGGTAFTVTWKHS